MRLSLILAAAAVLAAASLARARDGGPEEPFERTIHETLLAVKAAPRAPRMAFILTGVSRDEKGRPIPQIACATTRERRAAAARDYSIPLPDDRFWGFYFDLRKDTIVKADGNELARGLYDSPRLQSAYLPAGQYLMTIAAPGEKPLSVDFVHPMHGDTDMTGGRLFCLIDMPSLKAAYDRLGIPLP